jgi:hypothetical protein
MVKRLVIDASTSSPPIALVVRKSGTVSLAGSWLALIVPSRTCSLIESPCLAVGTFEVKCVNSELDVHAISKPVVLL